MEHALTADVQHDVDVAGSDVGRQQRHRHHRVGVDAHVAEDGEGDLRDGSEEVRQSCSEAHKAAAAAYGQMGSEAAGQRGGGGCD